MLRICKIFSLFKILTQKKRYKFAQSEPIEFERKQNIKKVQKNNSVNTKNKYAQLYNIDKIYNVK